MESASARCSACSPTMSRLLDERSVYAIDGNRALMFKSAVTEYRKRGGERCQEHAISVVELAGSAAKRVPEKRVAFEVSNKPRLVLDREKHGRHRRIQPKNGSSQRPHQRRPTLPS